jgi:hypothetical protein
MLKIPTVLALAALATLASACTSAPARQGAAAPVVATTSAQPTKRLMNGFTLVMKNGTATYCRQDLKTGSHIIVQQRCLSQREYDSLEDDARRDMDRVRSAISPNMGTSGGSAH